MICAITYLYSLFYACLCAVKGAVKGAGKAVCRWFIGVLEGLDETGNAILGPVAKIPEAANPHYTMSQRWAYERQAGPAVVGNFTWRKACVICRLLTWAFEPFNLGVKDYDHCAEAIKDFPTDLPSEG